MKDFSLLYGPIRTWIPVLAMAVLATVVVLNQSAGSDDDCDRSSASDCAEPLLGERQLLGNGGRLDVAPAGPATVQEVETEPSPWDAFDPSTSEVPFVSLQPSPEPMTDAGEDLARSSSDDEVGADTDRP